MPHHEQTYIKKKIMTSLRPHNIKTKRAGDIMDETEQLLLKELHAFNKKLGDERAANYGFRLELAKAMAVILHTLEDYVTNPDDVVEIDE